MKLFQYLLGSIPDQWRINGISGYPHITVLGGKVYDLPVGLSFFEIAYSEPKLIGIAYPYEQVSNNRVKLAFKESFL